MKNINMITKIETEQQYDWAVERVEELLKVVKEDTPSDDPNVIELDLLSGLVADYSEEHYALEPPTFVETMELRMYEMGLDIESMAQLLGISPSLLREYLSGKTEPTIEDARTICQKLNIDTDTIER